MSDSLSNVCKSLAAAQGKLRKAVKESTNPHFRSRYADLESVIEAMREPFASEGLSVVQSVNDGMLSTTIFHASGESISSTVPLFIPKQDMQGVGSAITYARRYGLAAACGISQTDDDGNDACPAPNQSVKDINAEMVKRGAIQVPAAKPKQERETVQDERDTITAAGGPGFSVGGVAQMQSLVESNAPYSYPDHRDLVVQAAKELGISSPRVTANRDQLNEFLYTNAYGTLSSVKQAMSTFFKLGEKK
jgi:hypothetical protein